MLSVVFLILWRKFYREQILYQLLPSPGCGNTTPVKSYHDQSRTITLQIDYCNNGSESIKYLAHFQRVCVVKSFSRLCLPSKPQIVSTKAAIDVAAFLLVYLLIINANQELSVVKS